MEQEAPRFCVQCGKPLNGRSECECGYRVPESSPVASPGPSGSPAAPIYAQAAPAADAPPVGLWLNLSWKRCLQVLQFGEPTTEMPAPASFISMGLRALVAALLFSIWANALVDRSVKALGPMAFLLGGVGRGMGVKPFFWVFLGLVVAAAAASGVMYLGVGPARFDTGLAILSDAQWPLAVSLIPAWMLGYLSGYLSFAIIVAAVAWGQAVLAAGLGRLNLPYRHRMMVQVMTSVATVLLFSLILYGLAKNELRGLF